MECDDIPSVMTIEEASLWGDWSHTSFYGSLQGSDESWVVLKDHIVCGFIVFREIGDEAELLKIAVAPVMQKQGVGSMLLQRMLQKFHDKKIIRCFLEVRQSNKEAIALYQKYGFVTVGIRQNYYQHGHAYEHAHVMVWNIYPKPLEC